MSSGHDYSTGYPDYPRVPQHYQPFTRSRPSPGGGPMTGAKPLYAKYFQFAGRASRSEYWWTCQFFFVASMVLTFLGLAFGVQPTAGAGAIPEPNGFGVAVIVALLPLFLSSLVPSTAISVRRLHDGTSAGGCA